MSEKISLNIQCSNIAPLISLNEVLELRSLRLGLFANNGSGKTFLSRLFQLVYAKKSKTDPLYPVNSLLTLNKKNGNFRFLIKDSNGTVKEDFSLDISDEGEGIASLDRKPYYLYHVFNNDYVNSNIQRLGYEKDNNIQGFILGKAQIDLSKDENELAKKESKMKSLNEEITADVDSYIIKNLADVENLKRIKEYSLIDAKNIISLQEMPTDCPQGTVDEYMMQYNKIKSVPIGLSPLDSISIHFDTTFLCDTKLILEKEYTLCALADELKQKIKLHQDFYENGIDILSHAPGQCPFCKQQLNKDGEHWVDLYTSFFTNKEAQITKKLFAMKNNVSAFIKQIEQIESIIKQTKEQYFQYKHLYFESLKDDTVKIDFSLLKSILNEFYAIIDKKISNISISYDVGSLVDRAQSELSNIQDLINEQNNIIDLCNNLLSKIDKENLSIRRNLIKAAQKHLYEMVSEKKNELERLQIECDSLKRTIEKKRDKFKISKKKLVADTIEKILDYFFSGKYTLDRETFRLYLNETAIQRGMTKYVLSEGEKNIIAFAYYLGDTHSLISQNEDYEKLFFILDDPISSMDFNYVYTLVETIRDLNEIFPKIERIKFLTMTHNNDFMRILVNNNVIQSYYHLTSNKLVKLSTNFTVPYICHLKDIYNVAQGNIAPSHTTANSIRHIIETLVKWTNLTTEKDDVRSYISNAFGHKSGNYTLINDLSHGGWRTEQQPITSEAMVSICKDVIDHIQCKYPKHIDFCQSNI